MPVESIPQSDEQEFCSLLAKLGLDGSQFTLTLTNHPAATFGPRVKTIKICWEGMLEAEYGAAESTSWIEQFAADFHRGIISEIVAEKRAEQSDSLDPAT